jgi:hypothetical protein
VAPIPLAKVLGYTGRLKFVTFAEPLVERFAFVTRDSATVSPATRAMIKIATVHLCRLDLAPKHRPPQHITTPDPQLAPTY